MDSEITNNLPYLRLFIKKADELKGYSYFEKGDSIITWEISKNDDGTFSITGEKIFISGGDHDLSENIIHPVLARIEGAPAGTKGISLFVVPKKRR